MGRNLVNFHLARWPTCNPTPTITPTITLPPTLVLALTITLTIGGARGRQGRSWASPRVLVAPNWPAERPAATYKTVALHECKRRAAPHVRAPQRPSSTSWWAEVRQDLQWSSGSRLWLSSGELCAVWLEFSPTLKTARARDDAMYSRQPQRRRVCPPTTRMGASPQQRELCTGTV